MLYIAKTVTPNAAARAEELQRFAEEEGIKLPLSIDLILWLEDHGRVVDLITGKATPLVDVVGKPLDTGTPTPSGVAVNYLLTPPTREERRDEAAQLADTEAFFRYAKAEASDYEEYMLDREFWSRGQW